MEYLNILVLLILIFCVDRLRRELQSLKSMQTRHWHKILYFGNKFQNGFNPSHFLLPKIKGQLDKVHMQSKMAEKMSERAFNMASTANLGVIALQKTLHVPKIVDRQQTLKNKYAKAEVDKLFTTNGGFEFLKPILDDDELELLEEIEKNGSEQ